MISHEYASVLITLHELALFLSCSKLYVLYIMIAITVSASRPFYVIACSVWAIL